MIDAEIEAEDLPHIHSVSKALHWAGHLWQYLTKRWLRLTIPMSTRTGAAGRNILPGQPSGTALHHRVAGGSAAGARPRLRACLPLFRLQSTSGPDGGGGSNHAGSHGHRPWRSTGLLCQIPLPALPVGSSVSRTNVPRRGARQNRPRSKRIGRHQHPAYARCALGAGRTAGCPYPCGEARAAPHMALGVFTSAGVAHLRVQREADVSNLGDLLLYSLDELEEIAAEKGGIRISSMRSGVRSTGPTQQAGCSPRARYGTRHRPRTFLMAQGFAA